MTAEFLAGVISLLLGILGVLTETRDRTTGRLTRWGWWTLTAFVVAAALAGWQRLQSSIEAEGRAYEESARNRDALSRSDQELRLLRRSVKELHFARSPLPQSFTAMLQFSVSCDALDDDSLCDSDETRILEELSASQKDAFLGALDLAEPDSTAPIDVQFWKDRPPRPDDLDQRADFAIRIHLRIAPKTIWLITSNSRERRLDIHLIDPLSSEATESTSRVTSLLDLAGTTVTGRFFSVDCGIPSLSEDPPCALREVRFYTPTGRVLTLNGFAPLPPPNKGYGARLAEVDS